MRNKNSLGVFKNPFGVLLVFSLALLFTVMLVFALSPDATYTITAPANFTNQTYGYVTVNITSNYGMNYSTVTADGRGTNITWRNESGAESNVSITVVKGDKNYTYANVSGLLNGTHMFYGVINNSVDNATYITSTLNITVDNGVPTSAINNPANSTNTTNTTIEIRFTLTDNVATNISYVIWDNSIALINGTALNNTLTGMNITIGNGTRVIKVEARDWPGTGTNSTPVHMIRAIPSLIVNSPTPANFTNQTAQYYYINVSNGDSINNATVEWTNQSSVRGNISMIYDANNNYTYINITGMLNGTHMFIVWINDSITDLNYSISMNVTVDNGNPVPTILRPSNNTNTSDSTPTIEFNITDNVFTNLSYIIYEMNSSGLGSAVLVATISNNTNQTYDLSLVNGSHYIFVEARDNAGNRVNSTGINLTVDDGAPSISIINYYINNTLVTGALNTTGNNSNITSAIPELTLNATDNVAVHGNLSNMSFIIYVDGAAAVNGSVLNYSTTGESLTRVNVTKNGLGLLNGTHIIIVEIRDAANNRANTTALYLTVDTVDPTPSFSIPSINNTNMSTNEVEFTLTDNVATNLSYVIYVNNTVALWGTALNNTATRRNVTNMTNDTYYINIEVRDYGNGSYFLHAVNSTQFNITVDNSFPTSKINGFYNGSSLNITGNMTNTTDSIIELILNITDTVSTNMSFIVYVDGASALNGTVLNATSSSLPRVNVTLNTIGLLNGSHLIKVEAKDRSNNRFNSTPLNITIDTLVPSIIISTPANNSIYGRNITLSYITVDSHTAISECWYANGTSETTALPNCANITFLSLNKNSLNNITFYVNDTAGNINSTGAIFFNSSTFQLYLNLQNSTFGNVANATVIVSKMAMGPGQAQETWNGTAANGRSDVNGNITIDNLDATWQNPFQFTIAGYNGTDMGNAILVGPILPPLPGPMLRNIMNGTTLYLVPAANINISAYNATANSINFSGMIFDSALKFPVAMFASQRMVNYTVAVPRDRNYTITIFRGGGFGDGAPPNSVTVTDKNLTVDMNVNTTTPGGNNGANVPYIYSINISLTTNLVNFTGYLVNGSSPTQPWNASYRAGMTFGTMVYMMVGGQVALDTTMPIDMGHPGYPLMLNLTTNMSGIFNIPLIANRSYVIMVFANDSTNYYGGIINVSLPNNTLLGEINISMYPLAGALVRKNFMNASMTNFSLIDGTNASNLTSAGQGHIEVNATYPTTLGNLSVSYMLDSDSSGTFQLYLFDNRTTGLRNPKIKVMSNSYAPREYQIKTSNLFANSTINITMKRFSMESTGGSAFAGISVYFLVSNSTCNVPQPSLTVRQSGGCLVTSANSDSFNPLTIMTGGKMTVRMVQSNGITLQYENVDMMASGPPDAAYDSSAAESSGRGTSFEQAWKFGSMGPDIYDRVLIGIPYSDDAYDDSQSMKMKLKYLYDQDWNPVWNMSAGNSTNDLPTGFEDYGLSTYQQYVNKSGTGMSCGTTDSTSTCFINTTSNMIWFWLPHFSGNGPSPNGTGDPPGVTSTSYSGISLSGATIAAITNEAATCKYSSTNVAYDSMNATFSATGTTSHSQSLTGLSSGTTYTYYIRCTDSYGNKMASSASVVFTTSSSGGTTTPSSGTTVENKETSVFSEMNAGTIYKVTTADTSISIKQIFIEVNNRATSVEIIVSKYSGKPSEVKQDITTGVYQYIGINHTNLADSNLKTLKIKFSVPKSWLTANNYADSKVRLMRYTSSGWTTLTTTKVNESSANIDYEAVSPGLSIFAISVEAEVAAPPAAVCGNNTREGTEECDGTDLAGQTCSSKGFTGGTLKCKADCKFDTAACTSAPVGAAAVCGNDICETGETPENCAADCAPGEVPTIPYWVFILIVVVVLVGVGGYIYYYKINETPKYKSRR